jgi:hypothetical protein
VGSPGARAAHGGARLLDLGAVLLIVAGLLSPAAAHAASRPEAEQAKIDWLLDQIRASDAVFIRNGSEYDGKKAASHMKSKLFWAGSRVQTAHDFIVGCATKSEESGKPYLMRPKGSTKASPLGDWLLARLAEHEKAPAPAPTKKAG